MRMIKLHDEVGRGSLVQWLKIPSSQVTRMFRSFTHFWLDENGAVTPEAWLVTGVLFMGSIAALLGLVQRAGDAMHVFSNHQVIDAVTSLFIPR
jgi:hypothetical protein